MTDSTIKVRLSQGICVLLKISYMVCCLLPPHYMVYDSPKHCFHNLERRKKCTFACSFAIVLCLFNSFIESRDLSVIKDLLRGLLLIDASLYDSV